MTRPHDRNDESRVTTVLVVIFSLIIVLGGIRWLNEVLRAPVLPNTPPPLIESTRVVVMRTYGDTASGSFYTFTDSKGFICYTDSDHWLAVVRGDPVSCIWEPPKGAKLP